MKLFGDSHSLDRAWHSCDWGDNRRKLKIVRESDAILRDEIKKAGLDRDIWQYFTALPDFRSVGVMGDARTYDYTIGIRAVTSIDGMTSDWARISIGIFLK